MKEQLKCKVVMLDTRDISTIAEFGELLFDKDGFDPHIIKTKHLYLISDRKIKVGDWYHNPSKTIFGDPHNEKCEYEHEAKACLNEPICKKIEATTDLTLNLPRLSESFIQAYVKANSTIDEISCTINEVNIEIEYYTKGFSKDHGGNIAISDKRIKVREDNTVIIHPVKTYTRDEVIKLLHEIVQNGHISNEHHIPSQVNRWIEKNL
jgi:hypothetical protein